MRIQHLFFIAGLALLVASCKKKEEEPPVPNAGFTVAPTEGVIDQQVQFTNTSADATAFAWSFGDGTTSTDKSPVKTYTASGIFTVTLVATGAGGSESYSAQFRVGPQAAFTVEDADALNADTPVQFVNASKGAATYQWSFGDPANSTSTEANPSFTYPEAGTYTVTLTAGSSGGNSTAVQTITVAPGAPAIRELYYIEYNSSRISKLTLDGTNASTQVLSITGKRGPCMAWDPVHEKLYYSDFEVTGSGNIWQMNPDGSGLTAIVSNLTDPYGLDVDPVNGKIYWVDDAGNVSRANLDGSDLQTGIVNIPSGQMRAISLDVENNKMYFYEVNVEVLYVANLDGSNVTPLLTGTYGYAVLVDTVNDKLYYDDQNAEKLYQCNLDGSGKVEIDTEGSRIYGMAIDHTTGKLYWSGRDSAKIKRANLDGSGVEVLKSGVTNVRGIALK